MKPLLLWVLFENSFGWTMKLARNAIAAKNRFRCYVVSIIAAPAAEYFAAAAVTAVLTGLNMDTKVWLERAVSAMILSVG